jgi:hypothetical protein
MASVTLVRQQHMADPVVLILTGPAAFQPMARPVADLVKAAAVVTVSAMSLCKDWPAIGMAVARPRMAGPAMGSVMVHRAQRRVLLARWLDGPYDD